MRRSPHSSSHRDFTALVCAALAALVAFGAGAGCAPPDDAPKAPETASVVDHGERVSPLERELIEAAEAHHVPVDALKAIAWMETRWKTPPLPEHATDGHGAEPGHGHSFAAYGIMGLRDAPQWGTVQLAADLLGVDEGQVVMDRATNAMGAAAVVRHYTEQALGHTLTETLPVEAYADGIARIGAGERADLHERYTRDVFRLLASGMSGYTEEGLPMRIAASDPQDMPTALRTREQAMTDYDQASWTAAHSTNYSNRSRTSANVSHITVHVVQGSYAGCISWFQNPSANVSAHYVVRSSDGDVTQMVRHQDMAWHVGSENGYTIGIEHEGWVSDPAWFTDAMYRSSARLTRHIADTWGIPIDRQHIKGHVEFPNQSHTDPGPHWDWDRYMEYVRNNGSDTPVNTGDFVGFVREGDIYNTDQPLSGVTISVGDFSTTTNADGFYRLSGLPFGPHTITAARDGYQTTSIERTMEVRGGDNWASIALNPAPQLVNVVGFVRAERADNAAAPLAGATVALSSGQSATTGPDGAYRIDGLQPGAYTFTVSLDGYTPATAERTLDQVGQDQDVSFGLAPIPATATLTGRVLSSDDDSPIPGAVATLEGPVTATATADPTGRYTFAPFPLGAYTLTIASPDHLAASWDITFDTPDTQLDFDARLTPLPSDPGTNNGTTGGTNNGTTSTNNGTTSTNNGTTSTNNATTAPDTSGTSGGTNGTASTSDDTAGGAQSDAPETVSSNDFCSVAAAPAAPQRLPACIALGLVGLIVVSARRRRNRA